LSATGCGASVAAVTKTALILTVRTLAGKRDALRALWEEHLRPRAEVNPAQELYLYCYDADDPDTIHIVEVYGDAAEMGRNASAPWFADYMRAAGPLLAGPPSIHTAEPVWAKGYAVGV
jgi:quinol monooxygenase YgiN